MWCVNPETGEKTKDFQPAPGPHIPKCGECFYDLMKFYESSLFASPLGRNKPECDSDGLFKSQQRSPSTGYTWCVNAETGEKIAGSDVAPGAGQANCEAGRKKRSNPGPCQEPGLGFRPMPGQYIPQCTLYGFFNVIQVHRSARNSWCVNPGTGEKIEGSDVALGSGKIADCGVCLYALAQFYRSGFGQNPLGRDKPECDAKGRFAPIQRSASTGYSWCVNVETGNKIPGSEVASGAGQANC